MYVKALKREKWWKKEKAAKENATEEDPGSTKLKLTSLIGWPGSLDKLGRSFSQEELLSILVAPLHQNW